MYRENLLYRKQKVTVKKLTKSHRIELLISVGANVDVSVNEQRHLLKISAYCFD